VTAPAALAGAGEPAVEDLPLVSFRGLSRAAWLIDGLAQLYMGLYDLPAARLLELFPVLGFFEALVYQCDTDVERAGGLTPAVAAAAQRRHQAVLAVLRRLDLLDPRAEAEMTNLWIYATMESVLNQPATVATLEQVRRAAELRTADVRALHAIIARQAGRAPDERYVALLWPLEVLGDLEQDLETYAEDVARGNYNTYRMFVRLFGAEAPARMAAELARYQEAHDRRLAELAPDEQARVRAFVAGHRARTPAPPIPAP